jgi:hypothetical protein
MLSQPRPILTAPGPVALIFFFFAAVLASPGWTATHRVPQDFPSIQLAIDAASSLDTVLVGPGTYLENLDLRSKWLAIIGSGGADQTIVDGQQRDRVVRMEGGGGGIIQGLTIRNGIAAQGAGVWVAGPVQATIQDCIIENNQALPFDQGNGGGIYLRLDNNGCVVRRNVIRNNYAGDEGGGIYDGSAVATTYIRENTLIGNGCHVSGGGARIAVTVFADNLVLRNWSDSFGGGVGGSGLLIEGNTIVGNYNLNNFLHGAGIRVLTSLTVIRKNIVAFNHGPTGVPSGAGIQSGGPVHCNNSWGNNGPDYLLSNASGTGNISQDPLFCDPSNDDYSISIFSPCAPTGGSCGLIGAMPPACSATPVLRTSWGRLKSAYR